jgi:signal transduction histidine kinase
MLDEIVGLLQQIKSVGDNIAHDLRSPLAAMRTKLERGLAADSGKELRAAVEGTFGDLEPPFFESPRSNPGGGAVLRRWT